MLGPPFRRLCAGLYFAEVASAGSEKLDAVQTHSASHSGRRRACRAQRPATGRATSSPPRRGIAGWKWVPRCLTMISPAFQLAAEPLDAQPLSIRVLAVRVEDAPFRCHIVASALDVCDFDLGIPLSVTLASAVTGLVLELQNANLGTFCFCNHFGCHRCRAERRCI